MEVKVLTDPEEALHFVEVDGGVGIVLIEDGRALLLCQGPPIVPPSRQFMGHVPPGVEVVHEAIDGVLPVPTSPYLKL